MATSLQAQLAQIASRTTNPLDLKAQRKAYSKSLLFEPQTAALQDVDTLYDICVDGFRELCNLDDRFRPFGRTLFSEQSKREDRSLLTSAQNAELDAVLEAFMGLLEVRLLLKPAIKALEWLIRHFRVHEQNTSYLLCTFISYHSQPVFSTLLSILPKKLPEAFKFLSPCLERMKGPTRQEIVHAAARHPEFVRLWTSHNLAQCRAGSVSHGLISYWASIFAEATLGRIEQASRGNRASQQEKEEALALDVLPIINEGLQIREVAELRIGCYMILTVLASKMALTDDVLVHMMQAAVGARSTETKEAELICLAALAQRRSSTKLPRKVYKALKSNTTLEQDLMALSSVQDTSSLTFSVARSMLRSLKKKHSSFRPQFFVTAIAHNILSDGQVESLIQDIIAALPSAGANSQHLRQTLTDLASTKRGQVAIRSALEGAAVDPAQLGQSLSNLLNLNEDENHMDWEEEQQENGPVGHPALKASSLDETISALPKAPKTFLKNSSDEYVLYYHAFESAAAQQENISKFCNIRAMKRSDIFKKPVFLSFFVQVWCGPSPDRERVTSIKCVCDAVRDAKTLRPIDVQVLLPYLLHAIADPSGDVRGAAIDLTILLSDKLDSSSAQSSKSMPPFEGSSLSGENGDENVTWLDAATLSILMTEMISRLEECRIDASYLVQMLHALLGPRSSAKTNGHSNKEPKTSQKEALLSFFASAIVDAPLHAVKLRLLNILHGAGAMVHYRQLRKLHGLIDSYSHMSENEFSACTLKEGLEPRELAVATLKSVSAGDREGLRSLHDLISTPQSDVNASMRMAGLERLVALWPEIKVELQGSIAVTLLDDAVKLHVDERHAVGTESLEILQQLDLDHLVLEKLLATSPPLPIPQGDQSSPSSKRRKVNHQARNDNSTAPPLIDQTQYMRRVTLVVELVEASKQGSHPDLAPTLFALLADLHHVKDVDAVVEYAQIRLLEALESTIESARTQNSTIDPSAVRVDLVVDYFRNASNAQLQQASLLLLATLAIFVPEQVIHSIMPIFTYMGSTIFRYSDEYSAHVVDKTIKTIIPPLIKSLRKDKRGPLAGAAELLLSFIAAFEHIPVQRRHSLFIVLIDKLGPEEFLYALVVMLLDKHGSNEKSQRFAQDLLAHYPPLVQLKAIEQFLGVVDDSLKAKPKSAKHLLTADEQNKYVDSALNIAELPVQLLKQQELLNQLARHLKQQTGQAEEVRSSFANILQLVLRLRSAGQSNVRLQSLSDRLLDASLGLLPLNESIKAIEPALVENDEDMKSDILRSIESRISKQRASDSRSRKACLQFLPRLQALLTGTENVLLKQTSIASIDIIAELFGKSDTGSVASVAADISGLHGLGSSDPQLRVRALLCLTTITEVLEDVIIPDIPKSAPACLSLLEAEASSQDGDAGLIRACYSFFNSLLLYIPYIVTGEYLDRLLNVSFDLAGADLESDLKHNQADCLALVPRRASPHECLASLTRTWEHARGAGLLAIRMHLSLLSATVDRLTKMDTVRHSSAVITLCLLVLDLRHQIKLNKSLELDDLLSIESSIYNVFIKTVYKLNDAHFRPIFSRLLDWTVDHSVSDDARLARSTSLYGFVAHLFGALKSIVTSYGGMLVDDAARLLHDKASPNGVSALLWTRIIEALSASFEFDQDGFWQSPSRFGTVLAPLITQLERASTEAAATLVISCITNLAQAADSPDNLKAINTAVTGAMRSEDETVRLTAVRCQRNLTDGLGEDWLALLPEMLPFISEAMEDDDEEVETEVRAWVRRIEETLGESLDSMLQ